jgi:hypothetical protein
MNTEIIETRPATRLLAEEEVREILREKFNDGRHWLLIVRGSAALMITRDRGPLLRRRKDNLYDNLSNHTGCHTRTLKCIRANRSLGSTPQDRARIQSHLKIKNVKHLRERYLTPLIFYGLLEMTDPDHPRTRTQKYRTTSLGRSALERGAE